MKCYLILIVVMVLLNSFPAFAQKGNPNGTQVEMNAYYCAKAAKAEARMNGTYKQILTEYNEDTVFIENFKKAQEAWATYQTAEMNAVFPPREAGYYGSIQPVCDCNLKEKLINDRLKTLNQWINGTEEGDVCAGTIKVKEKQTPAKRKPRKK